VSAMLVGCWLLGEALHLQAGRLGGLLVLMAVLQLYEGLPWRDREKWLAALAGTCGIAGVMHSFSPTLWRALGRVLAFVDAHRPRDAFGWGVVAVIAAFVLLAAGARRSLGGMRGNLRRPGASQGLVGEPSDSR